MINKTIIIPIKFQTKHELVIWMTAILLLSKIRAFGGIATGSIKANDPISETHQMTV